MKAIVVTDQAAGTAGMKLVERPEPQAAQTTSSFRFMRRDSSRLSWRGPRPGPIASTVIEHPRSPGTSWPEWSPPSAMARGGCRLFEHGPPTAWHDSSRRR